MTDRTARLMKQGIERYESAEEAWEGIKGNRLNDGQNMNEEKTLLSEAEEIIEGKSETHGSPEDSFGRIARYWTVYLQIEHGLNVELSKADTAEMMALFKLARAQSGEYNDDDYRDRLGYVKFASDFRND